MGLSTRGRLRLALSIAMVLGWMVFIFYMSEKNGIDSEAISDGLIGQVLMLLLGGVDPQLAEDLSYPVRKLAHFSEYAVLGALLANAFRSFAQARSPQASQGTKRTLEKPQALGVWLVGTLYAATDECHQIFVPGRSAQLGDVLIDSSGVLLGLALFLIVSARLMQKQSTQDNRTR